MLHRYDWSESSVILDLFTREQGRIAVAAKGAKRPFSQLRGVLLPFQRLHVSLGRSPGEEAPEVHALRAADWAGGHPMLGGAALFSGFYLNELLMKLLARHDPHAALFDAYAATIAALGEAADDARTQAALRAFELVLLREIGLLPDLATETASHRPVARRAALPGPRRCRRGRDRQRQRGDARRRDLAALEAALGADPPSLQRVAAGALGRLRPLLRAQLHYHLGTSQLRTRQVMIEAQALDR